MDVTKLMKRAAAGTAMAGTVSLGILGFGSGTGFAKPDNPGPGPGNGNGNGNGNSAWVPGDPPGQNPFGPPGQVMKAPTVDLPGVGEVTNPFLNVPPGHWGDPVYTGLPATWLPDGYDLIEALPLVLNPETLVWGVWLDGVFVPYVAPVMTP